MSPSRRRAVARCVALRHAPVPRSLAPLAHRPARGGSPPRCAAWQVAHAESFAGASPCAPHSRAGRGVRSITRGTAAGLNLYALTITHAHYPAHRSHARALAVPRAPRRRVIAHGGSPPRCLAATARGGSPTLPARAAAPSPVAARHPAQGRDTRSRPLSGTPFVSIWMQYDLSASQATRSLPTLQRRPPSRPTR